MNYKELKPGDTFATNCEYGGRCLYRIVSVDNENKPVGLCENRIYMENLTLLKEPVIVTPDWFADRALAPGKYIEPVK